MHYSTCTKWLCCQHMAETTTLNWLSNDITCATKLCLLQKKEPDGNMQRHYAVHYSLMLPAKTTNIKVNSDHYDENLDRILILNIYSDLGIGKENLLDQFFDHSLVTWPLVLLLNMVTHKLRLLCMVKLQATAQEFFYKEFLLLHLVIKCSYWSGIWAWKLTSYDCIEVCTVLLYFFTTFHSISKLYLCRHV